MKKLIASIATVAAVGGGLSVAAVAVPVVASTTSVAAQAQAGAPVYTNCTWYQITDRYGNVYWRCIRW